MSRLVTFIVMVWLCNVGTLCVSRLDAQSTVNASDLTVSDAATINALNQIKGFFRDAMLRYRSRAFERLNNKSVLGYEADIIYIDSRNVIMCDISRHYIAQADKDGYPVVIEPVVRQIILKNDAPQLVIRYKIKDGTKVPTLSTVNLKIPREDSIRQIRFYAEIGNLVGDFPIFGTKLEDLLNGCGPVESIGVDEFERVQLTDYGRLSFRFKTYKNQLLLTGLRVDRTGEHLLSTKNKTRLSDIETSFSDTLNVKGIDKEILQYSFTYNDVNNDYILSNIKSENLQFSGSASWGYIVHLDFHSHIKSPTDTDISSVILPLPDGHPVQPATRDLQHVELTTAAGEIVRKVDGAPLAQVEVEVAQARRMRWIVGSAVAVLVMATLGWWLWQRRRSTRTT